MQCTVLPCRAGAWHTKAHAFLMLCSCQKHFWTIARALPQGMPFYTPRWPWEITKKGYLHMCRLAAATN